LGGLGMVVLAAAPRKRLCSRRTWSSSAASATEWLAAMAGRARTIREQSPRILHGSKRRVSVTFCRILPATAEKCPQNGGRCRD